MSSSRPLTELLLAACVAVLTSSWHGSGRRLKLDPPADMNAASAVSRALRFWSVRRTALAASVTATVLLACGAGGRLLAVAGCALIATAVTSRLVLTSRRRLVRRQRQRDALEFCDALRAELQAGLPIVLALRRGCEPWPRWRVIADTAALGGDVGAALRAAALEPGGSGLAALAACWNVAEGSGIALADVLDRAALGMRAQADARAEVAAALGPPRATAKLLACLPLVGLALGSAIGAHPASFLFGTTGGLVCLAAGVGLAAAGVSWVERLADAVER